MRDYKEHRVSGRYFYLFTGTPSGKQGESEMISQRIMGRLHYFMDGRVIGIMYDIDTPLPRQGKIILGLCKNNILSFLKMAKQDDNFFIFPTLHSLKHSQSVKSIEGRYNGRLSIVPLYKYKKISRLFPDLIDITSKIQPDDTENFSYLVQTQRQFRNTDENRLEEYKRFWHQKEDELLFCLEERVMLSRIESFLSRDLLEHTREWGYLASTLLIQ